MEKKKVMAYIGLYGDIFPLEEITAALQIEPIEAHSSYNLDIHLKGFLGKFSIKEEAMNKIVKK